MSPAQNPSAGGPTNLGKPEVDKAPWYRPLAGVWFLIVTIATIGHGLREVQQRVGGSLVDAALNAPLVFASMALITVVTHVIAWGIMAYGPIYAMALLTAGISWLWRKAMGR